MLIVVSNSLKLLVVCHCLRDNMRDSYDFSNGVKNPYVSKLKTQITIRIDADTVDYFKDLSEETGIKYQQLINFFLTDCKKKNMKPNIEWVRAL